MLFRPPGSPHPIWKGRQGLRFAGWSHGKVASPAAHMSQREDGTFSRADFTFDKDRNVYVCPAGNLLATTGTVYDGRTILYRTSLRNCSSCPIKLQCCPNTSQRNIPRDLNENARDHARALMGIPEFDKSRDERKKGRDALCAPQDPPSFRAYAPAGHLRCSRRMPSRRHRAEHQDPRETEVAATAGLIDRGLGRHRLSFPAPA